MQRNISSLIGYSLAAADGEIGKIEDFYFDDQSWTIRYLVVKTGGWLFGRKVLIAPQAIVSQQPWLDHTVPVNLTVEQVRNSPEIDADKPVSRQQEIELHQYYPWLNYWGGGGILYPGSDTLMSDGNLVPVNDAEHADHQSNNQRGDPHLRSTDYLTGFRINAADGEIGYIDDFIIDEQSWKIEYLVIDTRKWLTGRKVLIAPKWVGKVQWQESMVLADLSIETVKNDPEFASSKQSGHKE